VVVIAGDDHDLASFAERLAELGEEIAPGRERLAQGPVPQLEDVPQEDDALDAVERREQRRPELGSPQEVGPLLRTEVEV
jgi:hypothetical protein